MQLWKKWTNPLAPKKGEGGRLYVFCEGPSSIVKKRSNHCAAINHGLSRVR